MFASTHNLNPAQAAAVEHRGDPLLIVAGAGTGKTKTLVSRVVHLIENGADPNRVLLLTFTRRSASEMLQRVRAASANRAAGQVWGGTFHSVANRLLRQFGASAGLPPNFTVLDASDATDLFALVRTEEGFGERSKRFPRPNTIASIYSHMVSSQAKLDDVLENDFPWCADHGDDLKTIFGSYTNHKRANAVLDYDDLLLFWRGLTASTLGPVLSDLFDHILIDEYQDTNPIQADIVAGMKGPDTELCAVGDDAQAIYGFRSATVANMWNFAERFHGAATITLEQNYRSTMPILRAANAVLSQPIGGVTPHFAKELWSTTASGPTPQLLTCHDETAQSAWVADQILDSRERGVDLRDQAVLFRAGHHSNALELELSRRDIPFVKYGGLKHLEAAHVKDLLALLRVLDNPADQLAWHRVLSGLEGVGPATERRLVLELGIAEPETESLRRFLEGAGTVPAAARDQVAELRAAFGDCADDSLAPAAQINRLRPFCELLLANKYDNPAARLADLDSLANTAEQYRSRSRMLVELTLDPPGVTGDWAGPPHLDDDWLTLSTIHSAKGLEWRHVYLLHAADGNIPSDMAIGDKDGMAEELRLLYVAMTRAKQELSISFPLRYHVNRFGSDDRHVYAQMSRFLEPAIEHFERIGDGSVDQIDVRVPSDGGDTSSVADHVDTLLAGLWN
ncbi:MAG: ATP-dependent helicase [Acidimicrobiales bacterium]|nr:ATP-dependent helicase [Acidimicrobiales bacterium]